jgi:hypothetical protein
MDAVSRSALMSGIFSRSTSRWYQSEDLPLPLWPASTKAAGRSSSASA